MGWSQNPRLDHPEIDAQHNRMIEILNALRAGVLSERTGSAGARLLDELVDVAAANFRAEEKLIREQAARPRDFEPHIEAHQRLLRELVMLRDGLARRRLRVSPEIVSRLSSSFYDHLMHADRELESLIALAGPRGSASS